MRLWQIGALLGLVIFAWWAYKDAQKAKAAALQHAGQVQNANQMVGIVGTVVSYFLG